MSFLSGGSTVATSAPANALTGTTLAANVVNSSLTSIGTLGNLTVTNPIAGSVTGSASSATTATSAGSAAVLTTPRNINGVAFDGSANITVAAAAGTLSGATLASGVTASSLTSVGTLASLTLAGALSGVTDLTSVGNTILGNASTDTLNVGSGGLIKDASGNVGIGGNPTFLLDLVAPISAMRIAPSTTTNNALIRVTNSGNGFLGNDDSVGTLSGTPYALNIYRGGAFPIILSTNDTGRVVIDSAGQVALQTVGKGLSIKEGSNAKQGIATLVAGTAVVSNTSVTATSRIQLTAQSLGTVTVPTALAVSARTAGTSFTILSSNLVDTSVVAYSIFEPS